MNPVSLEEAAVIAGMNEAAFCRYLKKKTKKTYSALLNQMRVGYACNLD